MDGGAATAIACALLLLTGLPHGALDIELIAGERTGDTPSVHALVAVYLGLAAAMLVLWWMAPVLALVAFLLTAVVHFAEDWEEAGTPLALGTATALLCAPSLGHHAALAAVFVDLCGDPRAVLVADGLLMLAPVALCVALVCAGRQVTLGRVPHGVATVATLAAMTTLPPVVGFAVFFCALHSPRHLAEAWRTSVRRSGLPARSLAIVLTLTLAALGIAAALYALEPRDVWSASAVAAAFMTLSILTVPHMALPSVVAALTRSSHPSHPHPRRNPHRHADQRPSRVPAEG